MVAKLEHMDIICREIDLSNRRSTILRIGSNGHDLLKTMDENRSKIINKYLSHMDEKDLIEVMEAFRKLHQTIVDTQKGDLK